MSGTVLVTGATGNVGAEVVARLLAEGEPVRAAARSVATVAARFPDAEAAALDFEDPSTFSAALAGVDRVFLVRPPQISDATTFAPFISAMREAGVGQVVFLSLLGAERNVFAPHHGIERAIRRSGVGWTMLRPSFFMQNLATTHLSDIRDRGQIVVPAGRGKTSFIDAEDIARAAVAVLTRPGHLGRGYDLTGSEALDYYQCAECLSRATGRTIVYTRPSGRAFAAHMRAQGHPDDFVRVMRAIYLVARLGMAGTVSHDLSALTGRPPVTFAEYAQREAAVFSAGGR